MRLFRREGVVSGSRRIVADFKVPLLKRRNQLSRLLHLIATHLHSRATARYGQEYVDRSEVLAPDACKYPVRLQARS